MASEDTKKYYWLKLYSDFFTSKRIKKLRKLAGGDTYTIIYLKMQLLALGTNGYIAYDGIEKNLAAELALDIDEKEDDVQIVINFLLQYRLMEQIDECTYLLPFVVECTGSETGKAIRLREARKKVKQISKSFQKYGTYSNVLLTENEKEKLEQEYGKEQAERAIEYLDSYIEEKGYKSKSHYLSIKRWVLEAVGHKKIEEKIPVYDESNNKEISSEDLKDILKEMKKKI